MNNSSFSYSEVDSVRGITIFKAVSPSGLFSAYSISMSVEHGIGRSFKTLRAARNYAKRLAAC